MIINFGEINEKKKTCTYRKEAWKQIPDGTPIDISQIQTAAIIFHFLLPTLKVNPWSIHKSMFLIAASTVVPFGESRLFHPPSPSFPILLGNWTLFGLMLPLWIAEISELICFCQCNKTTLLKWWAQLLHFQYFQSTTVKQRKSVCYSYTAATLKYTARCGDSPLSFSLLD